MERLEKRFKECCVCKKTVEKVAKMSVDKGKITKTIELRPIGIIHTNASDDQIREEAKNIEATIEIFPEFEEGLDGLEGYTHLLIISYFHKLRPEQIGPLKVKPKRLAKRGFKIEELPLRGVFTLDSPTRPNPIGLTLVRFLKRHGRKLFVSGNDLFDRTYQKKRRRKKELTTHLASTTLSKVAFNVL